MDLAEYKRYVTDRHPWELSRYEFFDKVLAHDVFSKSHQAPKRVLDAGAGDMWFSQQLSKSFSSVEHVTCWDESYSPEILNDLEQIVAESVLHPTNSQPTSQYDLVLAMDVLEHVEDDYEFLKAIVNQNLRPGGWILMSVPTWPSLFSNHDRALRHHRRYVPSEAVQLIHRAGLNVVVSGGLFHSLLPIRYLQSKVQTPNANPTLNDSQIKLHPLTSGLMKVVFKFDNLISLQAGRLQIPVPGLSWWALCQKPL